MGHMTLKNDIFRDVGRKLDGNTCRTPWNESLYQIIKKVYTEEEADLMVKLPFTPSSLERVAKLTKVEKTRLRVLLDSMCEKGLVLDFKVHGQYHYMPFPLVIGFFEGVMMRLGDSPKGQDVAKLFHEYMHADDSFYSHNLGDGQKMFVERTLPYEEAVADYTQILDYEKISAIIEDAGDNLAIGSCFCRHIKLHAGTQECDNPLNTCSAFNFMADYVTRHKMAKKVSKTEMLENVARSKELGLVINADVLKRNMTFVCHCCKCCCGLLLGMNTLGYPNTVVTSSFIADIDEQECIGCGKCTRACPINAIEMEKIANPVGKKKKEPVIDKSLCLGCGVCNTKCKTEAVKLVKRKERVIHPETIFERIMLQSLERGTVQNQMFDDPQSLSHKFMRGFVGGFLRLSPVKKALMSDTLRSTFLASMKLGVKIQGKGFLPEI